MNAEQLELFRKALLNVLDANRTRHGLTVTALGFQVRVFGFSERDFAGDVAAFREAITDELDYLAGKGLLEEAGKTVSAENRAWRLTTKGFQFVDSGA